MKILTIIGARPQFIKAATVSRVIARQKDITEVIVHTGQHYDDNMSQVFFEELKIPRPDYNLEVGSALHGKQTGLMLDRIEQVLLKEEPDWVLTYGDTNSTIAGALAAVKLHLRTAHVEAGLRSFNRKMPEEINRIATDHVSDLLLAPTQNAMHLLQKEGLAGASRFSGDVMYDSILFYKDMIADQQRIPELAEGEPFYLATIHRPENTDDPQRLQNIFTAFSALDLPVILPLHPRTRAKLDGLTFNDNVRIIEPVSYLQIVRLLADCTKVLTDSGGLQKEAYFMARPCVTLRDQTEWIETLENNWNFITAADVDKIMDAVRQSPGGPRSKAFGDGHAAEKVLQFLRDF